MPVSQDELPSEVRKQPGVYAFYGPRGNALYVGRTRDLFARIRQHSRRSKQDALLVARKVKISVMLGPGMHLVSLDAPERQFVDFCALRALFDLCRDCTLWVALTANRERCARLGVNDGDHLPSKTAKKLVIGLIPVCRQLTQFFELGLWQLNYDVKPNIRVARPGKVAPGVNVSGGHIQGRQSLWCRSRDSACDHERASKMKRQIGQIYKAKRHFLVPVLLSNIRAHTLLT
jgi:hypothetical protein